MPLMSYRLILASHRFCQLFKISQSSAKYGVKPYRVLSNTGCLVAGCCFSKTSDEEPLLNETVSDYGIQTSLFQENHRECSNMKRSAEIFPSTVSLDINISKVVEDSVVPNKKRKVDDDLENVDIKRTLSETDKKSLSSTDKGTQGAVCKGYSEEDETKQSKYLRPNYFVAVQISNQEIHQNLKNVQDHILNNEYNLKNCMLELKTLHITLMVMHIADAETLTRAMNSLKSIHQEYDKELSDNPLNLKFEGLGHFQNRVLYAKILPDDSYNRLCDLAENVKEHFAANEIYTTDKRTHFTPHLTVAKIDFKKKNNRGIKKINPRLYVDYADDNFGSQTIESIQLLSMTKPKNEQGYYTGDEIYFSAFDPNNSMNALSELLEVDKKKKEIKEAISSLMKDKLK